MSVLIKGIEMPKPGQIVLVEIDENGDVFAAYDGGRTKLAQYKAIPVPPHGRLIDVDALEAHGDCLSKLHVDFDAPAGHQVWRECVSFDDIPTVIPAEEEKNTNTWPEYRTQVLGTQKGNK